MTIKVPVTAHGRLLSHLPHSSFCCDSVMPQMQTRASSISLPHSLLSSMPLLCIYLLSSPPSLLPSSSSSSSSLCALTSPFPFHTQAASSTSPLLPFTLTSLRSSHLLLSVIYQHRPSFCCRSPTTTSSISPLRSFFPSFLHTRLLSLSRANSCTLTHAHADWHTRTERTLSLERRRPGGLLCATARLLDTELS